MFRSNSLVELSMLSGFRSEIICCIAMWCARRLEMEWSHVKIPNPTEFDPRMLGEFLAVDQPLPLGFQLPMGKGASPKCVPTVGAKVSTEFCPPDFPIGLFENFLSFPVFSCFHPNYGSTMFDSDSAGSTWFNIRLRTNPFAGALTSQPCWHWWLVDTRVMKCVCVCCIGLSSVPWTSNRAMFTYFMFKFTHLWW